MHETPEEIAKRLAAALENPMLPGYACLMPLDALHDGLRDALLSYGAAQAAAERDRVIQAVSAERCPECRAGGAPEYHEHWMAWYHGQLLCLGTSARHAVRALP